RGPTSTSARFQLRRGRQGNENRPILAHTASHRRREDDLRAWPPSAADPLAAAGLRCLRSSVSASPYRLTATAPPASIASLIPGTTRLCSGRVPSHQRS